MGSIQTTPADERSFLSRSLAFLRLPLRGRGLPQAAGDPLGYEAAFIPTEVKLPRVYTPPGEERARPDPPLGYLRE